MYIREKWEKGILISQERNRDYLPLFFLSHPRPIPSQAKCKLHTEPHTFLQKWERTLSGKRIILSPALISIQTMLCNWYISHFARYDCHVWVGILLFWLSVHSKGSLHLVKSLSILTTSSSYLFKACKCVLPRPHCIFGLYLGMLNCLPIK